MEANPQRGVSLVMTFLIMTAMLALVLNASILLFNDAKILLGVGSSVSALYAAESAIERTIYLNRKQIPNGGDRGFCNICSSISDFCSLSGPNCDNNNCTNCAVYYSTLFPDSNRYYQVNATMVESILTPGQYTMSVNAKGYYGSSMRNIDFNYTTP